VVADLLREMGYTLQANRQTAREPTIPTAMRSSPTSNDRLNAGWVSVAPITTRPASPSTPSANCRGSSGARARLWKRNYKRWPTNSAWPITVCHLPPGTSKRNKIELRLFAFITKNRRGKPLISYQTIVQLIAATRPTPASVKSEIDTNIYPHQGRSAMRRIISDETSISRLTKPKTQIVPGIVRALACFIDIAIRPNVLNHNRFEDECVLAAFHGDMTPMPSMNHPLSSANHRPRIS
jgi:hypothetical protein